MIIDWTKDGLMLWAWENMVYGGSIRWQIHCRMGVQDVSTLRT